MFENAKVINEGGGSFLKAELKKIFLDKGVEFCSSLDYSNCREINSGLIKKESFEPKSAIVFLIPYFVDIPDNISIYASSLDYHIIIKELSSEIISGLKQIFEGYNFKVYGDHSPIDERHAALISGLGIAGDHGLLINEKYGSYVFIADIVTDVPPDKLGAVSPHGIKCCEHCGACKSACPTGILSGNNSECLSAITQRKGELFDFEIDLMKRYNTVWGCDICQRACPHNINPRQTPIDSFYFDRINCLTLDLIEKMSDEEFSRRAFAWRKRKTIIRNLEYLDS